MNKNGRPRKAAQRRDQMVTVRLTADEKAKLQYLVKTEGGTITDLISRVINQASGPSNQWGAHGNKG